MKNKKLVIICRDQFGYLTDTYKYCEHLKEYSIKYYCIDWGLPKMTLPNVEVIYTPFYKNMKYSTLLFLLFVFLYNILSKSYFFITYFPYCHFLKYLLPFSKLHLDIRTLGIDPSPQVRADYDEKVKKTCSYFNSISVISEGLAKKIGLEAYAILPLGSDPIATNNIGFEQIRLLYVGYFYNRNIDKTVEGLHWFLEKYTNADIHYDIIGYGEGEDKILSNVEKYGLQKYVTFHGRKRHDELKDFFENCNVGVSFVPITDYYQFQPPTKTFEYIISGLFCLATGTDANKEIVTASNGIVINDNPQSFADALEYIYKNKDIIDQQNIKDSLCNHTWTNIVNSKLLSMLECEGMKS